MKNWYDDLTDEQIQQLKDNKMPLGLCPDWMQQAFRKAVEEGGHLKFFASRGWASNGGGQEGEITYLLNHYSLSLRLAPDWQRPEAEKKEEKWEYFDVLKGCGDYAQWEVTFGKRDWRGPVTLTLIGAMGVVGFDGIEFEERPNEWCMHLLHIVQSFGGSSSWTISAHDSADSRPATPKRIRVRK
jgi:hypothetical protein